MNIEEKIYSILEDYEDRHTIWREEEVNGEWECYEIDDDIISVFDGTDIEAHVQHTEMFDNPAITVYSVSVAWIENGELKSILNYQINYM